MAKSTGKRRDPKAATGNIATFALRMPEDLKQMVECAAEAHGRSMNSEICERLYVTLSQDIQPMGLPEAQLPEAGSQIAKLTEWMTKLERELWKVQDELRELRKKPD